MLQSGVQNLECVDYRAVGCLLKELEFLPLHILTTGNSLRIVAEKTNTITSRESPIRCWMIWTLERERNFIKAREERFC